ncbi:glycosyltransferase, partial [Niallia circulans]|uniref:glycosyltransferase n=1 Tax=Niallia circulans TaxID=1397 RepID=UPI00300A15F2
PLSDSVFTALHASSITFPRASKVLGKYNFEKVDLVLMDDPGLIFMKKFIESKLWVYRMTDIYSDMPNTQNSIEQVEGYISSFADKFIATSVPVAENFNKKWGKSAKVFENGVDYAHFQGNYKLPPEYDNKDKYRAVYVGSLDKRFNWDLLNESANNLPEVKFYVIGPLDGVELVGNLARNIVLLGSVEYDKIPAYLLHADVGLLPLINGNSNVGRSPMKLYEYGAAGLPIVATETIELQRRNLPFVFLAENSVEFSLNIEKIMSSETDYKKIAKDFSIRKSWNKITNDMMKWIYS